MYIVDQPWFQIISGKNITEALKVEKVTVEGKDIEK